ncbi:hypothetical protein OV090_10095 [Nannocystis sp. RBIL2]|uniref:DUF6892 domain-containing protein n=1 Tax=Nannocystis sp. RBIL2 TaxID=2996788 RepID=UPI00226E9652|nr:hypothetical protein [Nannocystis sp. RBIL2]MCY1065113.1 hypothetical protein [Nannocystis sp. RBIL2]
MPRRGASKPTGASELPLVEQAIAWVAQHGWPWDARQRFAGAGPAPVPAAALATLSLPGGRPLPPSFRRWLECDGRYVGVLGRGRKAQLVARPFREFVSEWKPRRSKAWNTLATLLPGDVVPLLEEDGTLVALYLGVADEKGEFPILEVSADFMTTVSLSHPSFDVWIAERVGARERKLGAYAMFDDPVHGSALRAQASRNLGGWKWLSSELDGERVSVEDGRAAIEALPVDSPARRLLEQAGAVADRIEASQRRPKEVLTAEERARYESWRGDSHPAIAQEIASLDKCEQLGLDVVWQIRSFLAMAARERGQPSGSSPSVSPVSPVEREQVAAPRLFADSNLQLAVLSGLLAARLIPQLDEERLPVAREEDEADWDDPDAERSIYAVNHDVVDALLAVELPAAVLARVEALTWPDEHLSRWIFPQWSGEEDDFKIGDLSGLEQCPALRSLDLSCSRSVDLSPLRRLPDLVKVTILWREGGARHRQTAAILRSLRARGVEVEA